MDRKVTDGLNTLNSKTGEMQKELVNCMTSEKLTGGLNKLVSKSGELQTGTTDHQMVWNNWLGTKPLEVAKN